MLEGITFSPIPVRWVGLSDGTKIALVTSMKSNERISSNSQSPIFENSQNVVLCSKYDDASSILQRLAKGGGDFGSVVGVHYLTENTRVELFEKCRGRSIRFVGRQSTFAPSLPKEKNSMALLSLLHSWGQPIIRKWLAVIAPDGRYLLEKLIAQGHLQCFGEFLCVTAPSCPNVAMDFSWDGRFLEAKDSIKGEEKFALVNLLLALGETSKLAVLAGDDPAIASLLSARRESWTPKSPAIVVDSSEHSIFRDGIEVASLQRKVVLRRLLYKFCESREVLLSKEELVRAVWKVDYHPFRHDPTLFTNIMRLRRLIGDKEGVVIRSDEGGYRFTPPANFTYRF